LRQSSRITDIRISWKEGQEDRYRHSQESTWCYIRLQRRIS